MLQTDNKIRFQYGPDRPAAAVNKETSPM